MRLTIYALSATLLLSISICAMAQTPPMLPSATEAPKGVIQSFDGKTLSVKTDDGKLMQAPLYPNARITYSIPKTLADIKPGDFVASAGTRGPDGKLHANQIIIRAPGGEGQFPMSAPGQVMTNATVKEVMTNATVKQVMTGVAVKQAGGAPIIKLSFHGAGAPGAANCTGHAADAPGGAGKGCVGETQFDVPANVPVVAEMPGDAGMLKPGAKATVGFAKGADGSLSVVRVTVER